MRPDLDLVGVEIAFGLLAVRIDGLIEADARGPSRLTDWTRGHLLTHIARNADGLARMAEGAAQSTLEPQYPGGAEERASDIEAGARRPIAALLGDVHESHRALVGAWSRIPDDGWERPGAALAGIRPVCETVLWRWREILVHLVDLDVGFEPEQLPEDYRERDAAWLTEHPREAWPAPPG